MRIIAGKYRRRIIKSAPSLKIRPTSDRLRETLFNILTNRIDDETFFLDLCAGTGAVGIEALSRGAGFATFVDKSRKACMLVEENLDLLQIPEDKTEVIRADAAEYIKRAEKNFNLIFYDPPYRDNYLEVLSAIAFGTVLTEDGILIVEHESKKDLPDSIGRIRRWRLIKQGSSSLSFYENC
ncbi:MAG: 16S rRNA (guanine(966)-N(2))-methyltransferase RsmD [Acidobacteria bacterium]|nr:MAG: 16S rRNA (guanine(966)-N(2))-methyltransferase RsmD [Acidobacteriota bacterium]